MIHVMIKQHNGFLLLSYTRELMLHIYSCDECHVIWVDKGLYYNE